MGGVNDRLVEIVQKLRELDEMLASYRTKYGLSDEEFQKKVGNSDLGDDEDLIAWKDALALKENLTEERLVLRESMTKLSNLD